MTFVTGSMLLIWFLAVGLMICGTFLSLIWNVSAPPHLDAPFALYPITVLKPLKGADEGLERNLASFFNLDYPIYELIFSVSEENDPATPVIRSMIVRSSSRVG